MGFQGLGASRIRRFRQNPLNCLEAQLQPISFPQKDCGAHQRIKIDVVQPTEHQLTGLARPPEFDQNLYQFFLARLREGTAIRT